MPSYVPIGCILDFTEDGEKEFWIDYSNDKGEIISYAQTIIGEAELAIDTENSKVAMVIINDIEGLIVYNKNLYCLHWSNEDYRFYIIGSDRFEIIKMAESLKTIGKN